MKTKSMIISAALVASLIGGALPALACSSGAVAAPNADILSLEDDATHWGMYCGSDLEWAINNTTDAATSAMLLDLSLVSGDPYAYAHAYRNLLPDPEANAFVLETSFNFAPLNEGTDAVHALQFGMESWGDGRRHEMALEWLNLGNGESTWRFWNGSSWVDTGIDHNLSPNQWHTLVMKGTITTSGNIRYTSFNVDGQNYKLRVETDSTDVSGEIDRLSVAVTMVGNFQSDPFDVFLDNVNFYRTVKADNFVDGPGSGKTAKAGKKNK